jgi:dihydroorotate dehydrogenase
MKKIELKDKILNEVLEDVRKYRDYLCAKKISPKFNFWDLRDSIEESLNHYLETGITNPIIRENQRTRVQ